jgi:hypothetical protein
MRNAERVYAASATGNHDRAAGESCKRYRAGAKLTLLGGQLTLRAVAHELRGDANNPGADWLVKPPAPPTARICSSEM